ncbi:iron ABC transporter permease [Bacillus sp. REN10]|uniref:FecCD family ABC transporter permease n=1 Tax=Bacillus sp. REN10 TaxID=2782541 RepID=UPI00193C4899|nr:iron ABC transporter permease [Bacillus sp. REN10]
MRAWTFRFYQEKISFQMTARWLSVCSSVFILLAALFMVYLSAGSEWVPVGDAMKNALQLSDSHAFVIGELRLPRALLAMLVGGALAVSGLILQSIVRNPLASPDIIGITSGASFASILFISIGTFSMAFLPVAAMVGGFITATFIYLLSWSKGVTPIRLVLIGIGVSAILKAGVTFLLVYSDTYTTSKAYIWITGSVYAATWDDVQALALWLLLPVPLILYVSKSLTLSELGDDIAISMGIRLQTQRFLLLMCSVILAASAAAYAGGIEFVGLMAPHMARKLVGRSILGLFPVTAMIGATLVLFADLLARTLFLPLDIPAGVFTATIGAPFFIYLLFHNRNR